MSPLSILIPVGPDPAYMKYLGECVQSVVEQMEQGDEVIIIDDRAHIPGEFFAPIPVPDGCLLRYTKNAWRLGCAASWNIGVGSSRNELCLLMGSDDKLLPGCLKSLREAYENTNKKDGWYNITVQLDNGETHAVFNNAAAVTRGLWNLLGGFPPSAGVGAPDALLISIMLVHMPDKLIQVREGHPLYWVRTHEAQDTKKQAGPFNWEVIRIRDIETGRWQPAFWD